MNSYFTVVLLASVVSGGYVDSMPHSVAVQKVGLFPSVREVHVSGHMGPAYVVPLPGYGYADQRAPSVAYHVPVSHQPLIGHAPVSAPVQHPQPMNQHAVVQHHQPMNQHAVVQHHQPMNQHAVVQHHQPMNQHAVVQHHQPMNQHAVVDQQQLVNNHVYASQNPSRVEAHHVGNLRFKDADVDAKSVEYELLEDVVSPVKKSTKTHKTSHHVSSKPVKHNRFVDSAYASASNSNHGDNEDYVQEEMHDADHVQEEMHDSHYVQEEMHDAPAMYHNSMKQQFPSYHSPVIGHVPASNHGRVMHGHNEIVQRGSGRYLGGEERIKSRSNGYVL